MITISFENKENTSLTEWIYKSIKNQILNDVLKENEKLPSKRNLALHLGVSVITIQNAYIRLIDEGYLFSIEKKGFFVSDISKRIKKILNQQPEKNFPPPAEKNISFTGDKPEEKKYLADFTSNSTATEKFPFGLWSKTMRSVLNSQNDKLLQKTDVYGVLELRLALVKHLKSFRNMDIKEDQIIIGAGTESLYSMLVQFFGRRKIFAVENPGYHKAQKIFSLNGTTCRPALIDKDGIIIEELEKVRANIVHVSPSHHFPTGITMNFKRRTELLEWAYKKKNRYIIEDDYDSEFRFTGKPLPTLQSIDNKDRVIYINTFSKTLSPSFRISYMVLPESLLENFTQKLGLYSCQVSSFEQYTLARFIDDNNYEKHLNKMKNYYRSLRNNLITAFNNSPLSKAFIIHEENSGLHFLMTLVSALSPKEIQKRWEDLGIKIYLLSDFYYSDITSTDIPADKTFIVNYSGIKKDSIPKIISLMSEALG